MIVRNRDGSGAGWRGRAERASLAGSGKLEVYWIHETAAARGRINLMPWSRPAIGKRLSRSRASRKARDPAVVCLTGVGWRGADRDVQARALRCRCGLTGAGNFPCPPLLSPQSELRSGHESIILKHGVHVGC